MSDYHLRKPCPRCSGLTGRIETRGGQDCVFCTGCGKFQYNAPKTETGRKPRSVSTVHEAIKPKQRTRILVRAHGKCELCGSRGDLHVGHIISVDSGLKQGMAEAQLNDDENLLAMCPECNLGLGSEPLPMWLLMGILRARLDETNETEQHPLGTAEPETVDSLAEREPW